MWNSWKRPLGWQVHVLVAAIAIVGAGFALAGNARKPRVEMIDVKGEDPGSTVFDLSGLADGESRVFGAGSRQLTAVREGDVVRLVAAKNGERKSLDASCKLATDRCQVITHEGDDSNVVVKIERRLECKNGVGDCADVDVVALGHGGPGVWVEKSEDCEGEDCPQREIRVVVAGDGEAHGDVVFVGEDPNTVVHVRDGVLLRCPEGDATLEVEQDEAGQTYLCPKHSVPMQRAESVKSRVIMRKRTEAK